MSGRLLADTVGWAGAGCLLVGYGLVSAGRIAPGRGYHLLNLAGAIGLAVNGIVHRAWPSTVVNLVWLVIGMTALHSRRGAATPDGAPRRR